MRGVWQFVTLRTTFNVELPENPISVVGDLASKVRPQEGWWLFTVPPKGQYLAGKVSANGFSVACVNSAYVGSKAQVRWICAFGKFQGNAERTNISVVVRQGLHRIVLNLLLLMLAVVALVGWPLLQLFGDIGSVFAAGCGVPALVLPVLWLFMNWAWWREVQSGREQITRVLTQIGKQTEATNPASN